MRPLGAAHLREEGVEVGRFPLAAAPVFHPAEAGKTLSRREFGNHCTPLGKQRQRGRPAEGNKDFQAEFALREDKHLSNRGCCCYFFFSTRAEKSVTQTLHERLGLRRDTCTHPNHLQVRQKSGGIKREVLILFMK